MRPLALLLIAYGLLELASFGVHSVGRGEVFSFSALRERRVQAQSDANDAAGSLADPREAARGGWVPADAVALHPYLGFTRRRGSEGSQKVDDHGFLRMPGVAEESPGSNPVIVAITGGSFAEQYFLSLDPEAFDSLSESPSFRGRPVRLVSLAMRGYKQPQQLLAITYFLSLGKPIDILINIDGFNELALADEIREVHGVFPAFPYHWAPLTRIHFTPDFLRAAGEIGLLREQRAQAARVGDRLAFSVTASVLWDVYDRHLQLRLAESSQRLEKSGERGKALPDFRRGPDFAAEGPDFWVWASGVWERSSLAIGDLAAGRGFTYFHFLQPNQYLPGSKQLTEEEREVATTVARYGQSVREGYPLLQVAGQRLTRQGIHFHDLTPIFEDVAESIYVDRCCHVGALGNRLLAAEITRVVEDHFLEPGGE